MRRSDVPRHEAEQFRRESPYHEDDTLYHNRRAQHHPEVLQGMHPIASADHYAAYHERQVAKDAAKRRYGHVKREEERKLERASELERDYYRATSDSTGILPRGHYNLAPLAGAVGNRELEFVLTLYFVTRVNFGLLDARGHEQMPIPNSPTCIPASKISRSITLSFKAITRTLLRPTTNKNYTLDCLREFNPLGMLPKN